MDAEEVMFSKAVAMAAGIEDAAKAAKLTTYGAEATDNTTSINKVNPVKTVPNQESSETVSGKST